MGARTAFGRRQASRFDPNPASGFDDPTVDIADSSFVHSPTRRTGGSSRTPRTKATHNNLGSTIPSKLRFAAQGRTLDGLTGAEDGRIVDNTVGGRRGLVDFSPVRDIIPGHPSPFPPSHVQPGSVGDRFYTPLIQLTNGGGEIWNAPIVAGDVTEQYLNQFCDGIPPEMLEGFRSKTVTLATIHGFSFGKSVLYLIADGSDPLPATLDGGTYSSRLGADPTGSDDALFSGVERFFVCTNGYTDADLPPGAPNTRLITHGDKGLDSSILGEGNPLNILGAIPTVAYDYSPLWNFELFTWTNYSTVNGIRTRLTAEFEVLGMAAAGYVTDPTGIRYPMRRSSTTAR
ncbi:hypothetical protein LTR17_027489 [Elasticomyces elasticus]|nr:hypothetical protein LTR17_027489 [Elasticomyces elasticus]